MVRKKLKKSGQSKKRVRTHFFANKMLMDAIMWSKLHFENDIGYYQAYK